MRYHPPRQFQRTAIRTIVPAVAGWSTYLQALVNLLLFGLAALVGEWVVHQCEYLIEYGDRFGAVMATTPHRFYMAPLGIFLALMVLSLLSLATLLLYAARLERRRLLLGMPARLACRVPRFPLSLPLRRVALTALTLTICQVVLYSAQENVESAAASQGWPGLAVLFAPQHLTVLPLHLAAASYIALALWMAAVFVRRSRRAVHAARLIADLIRAKSAAPPRPAPLRSRLLSLQHLAGLPSLRSPPLGA